MLYGFDYVSFDGQGQLYDTANRWQAGIPAADD